jgi:hypothetical protein
MPFTELNMVFWELSKNPKKTIKILKTQNKIETNVQTTR